MKNSIGVIYLARAENSDYTRFNNFFESYKKHSAGLQHELIILHKGIKKNDAGDEHIQKILGNRRYYSIYIPDTGYDIQAYLRAAKSLPYRFLCFFNTYSTILTDSWLEKLAQPLFENYRVAITGATASYESIHTSYSLYTKAIWMCSLNKIPFNQEISEEFKEQLLIHGENWLKGNVRLSAKEQTDALSRFLTSDESKEEFESHWRNVTKKGAGLYEIDQFKPFPNPHLRSNAFLINRAVLNSLQFRLADTKMACVKFESGLTGLPTKLAHLGFETRLIGANGRSYEVEEWPESSTFRLGNQENLLVSDNQTENYKNARNRLKNHLTSLTWGDYGFSKHEIFKEMGFSMGRDNLKLSLSRRRMKAKIGTSTRISIVIPTRNRAALLNDALYTIVSQKYMNWECVVFDNCSDEPLDNLVQSWNDKRIKYFRSNKFLPVTDSWNSAIDKASGDYITLLGDDDGLTPEFMSRVDYIVRSHDDLDFIYSSLFQYFHPGVAPWTPEGYIIDLRYGKFFNDRVDYFSLDPKLATDAVIGSFSLLRNFAFNMQSFCFSKEFLQGVRSNGKVFRSPFPDYYLANIAMATGKSIVVSPKALTIAGVSKASFGFTLFNNLEDTGTALLATNLNDDAIYSDHCRSLLPGPLYNTKYLITMLHAQTRLGNFSPCAVSIEKYRKIQILSIVSGLELRYGRHYYKGKELNFSADEIAFIELLQAQNISEQRSNTSTNKSFQEIAANTTMYGEPAISTVLDTGNFKSLRDVFDSMASERGSLFIHTR